MSNHSLNAATRAFWETLANLGLCWEDITEEGRFLRPDGVGADIHRQALYVLSHCGDNVNLIYCVLSFLRSSVCAARVLDQLAEPVQPDHIIDTRPCR